ncbi:MAG: terminase TerL endonuclease subunit [Rikenellaceae bacterium]
MAKVSKAEQYALDVRDGKILVGEYVKFAIDRHFRDLENSLDKGWHFDSQAASRAIRFIELMEHTKGEWAGRKFILEPWQCFIVWSIFGWKNADGTRRFRYAYIEVSRKNGKTALLAAIALYMLAADDEARAEVYSAATVKDQARICFGDAVQIVRKTNLKKYLTPYQNSISYDAKGGLFKPLSSDYGTHDGLNPSCAVIDEFHAHKDSGMFDVLKSAFGARKQPLMLIITTAGFNKAGPCYAYRSNAIKVVQEINEDDTLFAMIYSLDDADTEWDNPKMWCKANPNIGVSLSLDYLAGQVQDAKNRPEAVRNVMTKNLNLWVDGAKTWILDEAWMKCAAQTDISLLRNCDCWAGMDLSNVGDITAFGMLFHENGLFYFLLRCWIPEVKMLEKVRKENINYESWISQGFVKVTPGDCIDYNYIQDDILEFTQQYNVRSIAYDRWNSSQVVNNLRDEGLELSPFGQGFRDLNAPSKQLETMVLSQQLEHFGNPVLRWMIANTVMQVDPAGNIKPDKSKAAQKIDGTVALIMSIGEWMTAQAEEEKNPYASRGLLGD